MELVAGPQVVGVAPGDEGLAAVRMERDLEGHLLNQRVRVQPQDPLRTLPARLLEQLPQESNLRIPAPGPESPQGHR